MSTNKFLPFVARYNVLRDGKHIKCNIIGWKNALSYARKWSTDLFNQPRKVEILNVWTGEIIDLKEAERRAIQYEMRKRQSTQPIQAP